MRINPVNFYNNFNSCPKARRQPFFQGLNHDVFEKSKISFKGVPFGVNDSFLDEIKNMSEYELETVMNQIPSCTKDMAHESYEIAKLTEEMFDEKYGENNWAFVSIGTSPAGIGKALELRGHKVFYLPISDIRKIKPRDYHKNYSKYNNPKEYPEYFKYLDNIGLRKDKINCDDKHYLFVDYTSLGTTLNYIENFACSNGLNPEKAHFISINNKLKDYAYMKKDEKAQNLIEHYFKFYCMTQQMEYYAGIPHISYKETNLITEKLSYSNKRNIIQSTFEKALCYYHFMDSKQN